MKRSREYRRYLAEQKEKRFIRLNKESDALWAKARETTLVPLEKPLRVGWYRVLVWKNPITIKYRPDYAILDRLLHEVGELQWSMDKKFSYLGRSPHPRRWYRDKKPVEPLKLRELHPSQFGKLPMDLQARFYPVKHLNRWTMTEYTMYAADIPMSLLRTKVYPRYLYSYVEHDWQAERDCVRLDHYLRRNNLWVAISEAMGWSYSQRDDWFIDGRLRKLREDRVFAEREAEEYFNSLNRNSEALIY